jgi:hypothetical protein
MGEDSLLRAVGERIDAIAFELESSIGRRRKRLLFDLEAYGLLVEVLQVAPAPAQPSAPEPLLPTLLAEAPGTIPVRMAARR